MGWEYTSPGGGGSGGSLAIGDAIGNSPIANAVLFVSATGDLVNSANFKWNDGVEIVAPATTDVPLSVSAPAGQTADILYTEVNSVQTATINSAGEFTHDPGAGTQNETFGLAALDANTTGEQNTAFGYRALSAVSTGSWNTAMGAQSLASATGNQNTAIGRRSMFVTTSGIQNVAVGYRTLASNLTGDENVAIGYQAGLGALGDGNIFIGYNAGLNETGSNKLYIANSSTLTPLIGGDFSANTLTFEGEVTINTPSNSQQALILTATGSQTENILETEIDSDPTLYARITPDGNFSNNVGNPNCEFFGKFAGNPASSGNANTGVGNAALNVITSGLNNTAVGSACLDACTTGQNNTCLGRLSGTDVNSGNNNTSVGYWSMGNVTTGDENVAIGSLALFDNETGNDNVAIGFSAGENNLGNGNVFIGNQAGQNESGDDKLYIANTNTTTPLIGGDFSNGTISLYGETTCIAPATSDVPLSVSVGATQSVNAFEVKVNSVTHAIVTNDGEFSHNPATSGASNEAFGVNTMRSATTGYGNTAVGVSALESLTEGYNNVALGNQALYNTTTGANNYALGQNALNNNLTGNDNVAIGTNALYTATAGDNNVALGHEAGQLNNGSSNIFIGRQAGQNETGSNKLYIHNSNTATPLIHGDMGSQDLTFNAQTVITAPAAGDTALTINSASTPTSDTIVINVDATERFKIDSNGYLHLRGLQWPTTDGSNGHALITNGAGVLSFSAISGMSIGGVVGGGTNNAVMYVDGSGNAANSADFTYDGATLTLDAPTVNDTPLKVTATSAQNENILEAVVESVVHARITKDGEFSHNPATTGANNEAIGVAALDSATTGYANMAMGASALTTCTEGYNNVAIGLQALNDLTTGANNIALGTNAGANITEGDNNVAVGWGALYNNITGERNVGIGYEAGLGVTGTGSVCIGYRAGKNETNGDRLYIANSDTATPLIYGNFSTSDLTINGSQTITTATSDGLTIVSTGTGARAGLVCDNDDSVQFQFFMGGSLHALYPDTAALVLDDAVPFTIGHASATPRFYVSPSGSIGIGTNEKPTANDGDMLFFKAKSSSPTLASNTCGLYGEDFSGTVRLKVQDEDGEDHFLTGSYGEIRVEGNATATTISASSSDFSNKVQVTVFDTNGLSRGTTPDHTNDHITVNDDGVYRVSAVISFSGGTGDLISFAIFKNNGATQLTTRGTRELGSTDVGNASVQGLAELSSNDTVEIWIQNESDSSNVTIEDATLIISHV